MGTKKLQPWSSEVWGLARRQHWVVTRAQLLALGLGSEAIRHRLRDGRLNRVMRGVYAVGRPTVDSRGRWMAAVLTCGPHALLSHHSAAALLGICPERPSPIDVVVPSYVARRHPGIRVHRRADLASPTGWPRGLPVSGVVDLIPVTDPISTLVDIAMGISRAELAEAVNEADHLDLVDPESLREALDLIPPRPGTRRLCRLLDRETFVLTETRLEQLFLPLARDAGLPLPQTQVWLNDHRVDFYWPDLRLVVETDSLRYHRTPAKQAADNRRDQDHIAAGLMPLRFSHWQVCHEPDHVRKMLTIAAQHRVDRGLMTD
jgi:very-short-patch-repair endonuclease/predicted transcriptional regulator of viral defense system